MKKPVLKYKDKELEVGSVYWGKGERVKHVIFYDENGMVQTAYNRNLYQDEDESNLILSLDKRLEWK